MTDVSVSFKSVICQEKSERLLGILWNAYTNLYVLKLNPMLGLSSTVTNTLWHVCKDF